MRTFEGTIRAQNSGSCRAHKVLYGGQGLVSLCIGYNYQLDTVEVADFLRLLKSLIAEDSDSQPHVENGSSRQPQR